MINLLKNKKFIWALVFLGLFIIVSVLVSLKVFDKVDKKVIEWIYELRGSNSNRYGFFYWINRSLTELAYIFILIPGCIVVLLLCKGDLKSIFLSVSTATNYLIYKLIKMLIARERPDQMYQLMEESSKSYPSGHTANSTLFYFFLAYIVSKSNINPKLKKVLITICMIIPFVVGLTRINLSVHYPSDVLGGLFLGSSVCLFAIVLLEHLRSKGYNGVKSLLDKNNKDYQGRPGLHPQHC